MIRVAGYRMVTPDGSIISLESEKERDRGEGDESPRLAAWQMAFDVSSAYILDLVITRAEH